MTTEGLTIDEHTRLRVLENTIRIGLKGFADTGRALREVRDERLYRADFASFEDYCQSRWGMSRQHAYRLMEAVGIVEALSPRGDVPAPASEKVARELGRLSGDPGVMQEAWEATVAEHGPTPTAAQTRAHVEQARPAVAPTPLPLPPPRAEHDTRFEMIESAVELLKLLPEPEQTPFPTDPGDVDTLDEEIAFLAEYAPRLLRAWKAHRRALRRPRAVA